MKRLSSLTVILFYLLFFFVSCQKEISFEAGQKSVGTLQDDVSGDCLPKLVHGSYVAGTALNGDSNYIEVQVNVLAAGSYTVKTDTVNGYYFTGSGNFSNTGLNMVRLRGAGNPQAASQANPDMFTVSFDSSFCTISIIVSPAGGGGTGPAAYTLDGAPNQCGSFTPNGSFTAGTALSSGNTVTVGVNVTTAGSYSISTNTVNGYSFSTTGTFSSTGAQVVTLTGTGTPTAAGTDNFTVTAGSNTCSFSITVNPGTGPITCGTPNGTYTVGTALASSNTVTATHTYRTTGTYTVSTNTVNGYSFRTTVNATGGTAVNITMPGTGTPTAAGTNTFTLDYGDNSNCTFTVTVNAATQTNTDHFILTNNSWWSYDIVGGSAGDTLKRSIIGSVTYNNSTWKAMQEKSATLPLVFDDTLYFRKTGTDYKELNFTDYYTTFYFDTPQVDSLLFLKEGLNTNDTWTSPVYSGTVNNVPTTVKFVYLCTNNNATVTVNGRSYSNVYIVQMTTQKSTNGGAYTTDLLYTNYYAQGIGWIYQNINYNGQNYPLNVRSYQVF